MQRHYSKFLLAIFFSCCLSTMESFAQQVLELKWKQPIVVLDTTFSPVEALYFEGARTEKNLWPYYTLYVSGVAEDFTILNPVYVPLTDKENALARRSTPPSGFRISTGVQNGRPVSTVRFVPIRMNPQTGVLEKLVRFSYQYRQGAFQQPALQRSNSGVTRVVNSARMSSAASSVLASGSWYKLSVPQTGMYKIDYAFLRTMGINPDVIDPRTIRLHGNGGAMLPQSNSASRIDDLQEMAIEVIGEADGVFNTGDYILFYAYGPDSWQYNISETIFNHQKNIYSEKACYFLTYGGSWGNRVQDQANIGSAAQSFSYFDDRQFIEQDNFNILNSGRHWYGQQFGAANTSATLSFATSGLVSGSTVYITSAVVGRSVSVTSFSVRANGSLLGTQTISPNSLSEYDAKGLEVRNVYPINSSTIGTPSSINITLDYSVGSSATSIGHLNYLEINARRALQLYGNQTSFRVIASTGAATAEYQVGNAAGATIWNVSNLASIKRQAYTPSGATAVFSTASTALEEYVVYSGNSFAAPTFDEQVGNQNLHSIAAPNLPDLVIVTHPSFLSEANRLADFRRANDQLGVVVVTTNQVYNEFSSGAQDVTAIRDFMKMLYDRRTGADSVRYLLLFGDCSYDYLNRISGNTNYVPVYQSRQSLKPLESYSSDDYFGFLDNSEGDWSEAPVIDNFLDIGIGRLPVKSADEASVVVNKLIHYSSSKDCLGKWRNMITFVADDGDNNLHQRDANDLATKIDTTFKVYNLNKIYLDAYRQTASPGGERAPDVNRQLDEAVNKGTFILNYSGHGGETIWAQENILNNSQIDGWENGNTIPFLVTATCDFGRYDDPGVVSGAEVSLLKGDGGSIGLITATRVVFAFSNKALNLDVYDYIFKPLADGTMPRLGDMTRQTKNVSIVGVNNRNYALLGDPSLRLTYPQQSIAVTKIRGINVSVQPDTLKALSKVSIQGELRDRLGNKLTDFNGVLAVTIFDKAAQLTTFGTEGSAPFTYRLRNNFLFDGSASVAGGDWSVTFVVPKDISYQFDFGKISTYAIREGQNVDGAGAYTNVIIGGTDPNAPADNTPPRIRLFMNDETFVFGGLTGTNPLFIAKLSDENGINTAGSGIGHEIAATLDNSETPIILNQFYTANLNDYQNGSLRYPLKDLSAGPHSIRLKAWDTYNNSAENNLEFLVANDERIALSHILNYPNPFSTRTEFHFDHNRAGEELDVMIQIYTVSGKLVKTLDTKIYTSGSHFSDLQWDGRDDYGDRIGRGVYVYRVQVRAPRDGSSVHKYEKLVLLN